MWNAGFDDSLAPKDSFSDDDVNKGFSFQLETEVPADFVELEEPENGRGKAGNMKKQRGRRGGRKRGASQSNQQGGMLSDCLNTDQSRIPDSIVMNYLQSKWHWFRSGV